MAVSLQPPAILRLINYNVIRWPCEISLKAEYQTPMSYHLAKKYFSKQEKKMDTFALTTEQTAQPDQFFQLEPEHQTGQQQSLDSYCVLRITSFPN